MRSYLLLSLFALSSLNAVNSRRGQAQPPPPKSNPLNESNGTVLPSGSPQPRKGSNLFVQGDALYWRATENGLAPVMRGERVVNNGATAIEGKYQELKFKWDWGYRVGVGYNLPHDKWDLLLNWTHVCTTAKRTDVQNFVPTGASGTLLYPVWVDGTVLSNFDTTAVILASAARWRLHLNLLDFEIGRQFFVSKWLTLRPHLGLRSAWINQKYQIAYAAIDPPNTLAYAIQMKNEFWGLGVRGGLDTQWGVFKEISIYGNLALSLLYGHFDVKEEIAFTSTGANPLALRTKDPFNTTRAITDLAIGLRWDHSFVERLHLRLQAGWEHHLFFGQNQFYLNTSGFPAINTRFDNKDLALQGWTFGTRLDF